MMKKSFSVALRETFGRPGETVGNFGIQLKALTPEDKSYYSNIMAQAGIDHEPPTSAVVAAAA